MNYDDIVTKIAEFRDYSLTEEFLSLPEDVQKKEYREYNKLVEAYNSMNTSNRHS